MKNRIPITVIALFALSTGAAFAEQQPAAAPSSQGEFATNPGPGDDENARKKIEAIRVSRLTEALNLDEKTAAKFIPAITALDLKRRATMREHRLAMMELRRQVQGRQADSSLLKITIDKFATSRREMTKLREKEFDTAREHLTTDQLARYLLFQQDFLQEVRELVSGMRGGGPGMRGPGMGPEGLQNRR
mgnify:CR=1 FL=1